MFGIDGKILVIAVVALVLLGPEKLPGILRAIAKGYGQLRRMTMDVRSTLEREIRSVDEAARAEQAAATLPAYRPEQASDEAQAASSGAAEAASEAKPATDAAKEPETASGAAPGTNAMDAAKEPGTAFEGGNAPAEAASAEATPHADHAHAPMQGTLFDDSRSAPKADPPQEKPHA